MPSPDHGSDRPDLPVPPAASTGQHSAEHPHASGAAAGLLKAYAAVPQQLCSAFWWAVGL